MSISVTIRRVGVYNPYGIALAVGTTYSLDDAFALSLISNGGAVLADSTQPPPPNNPFSSVPQIVVPPFVGDTSKWAADLNAAAFALIIAKGGNFEFGGYGIAHMSRPVVMSANSRVLVVPSLGMKMIPSSTGQIFENVALRSP